MVSWTAMAVSSNSTAMTAGGNSTYNGTTTTATDTFSGATNSTSATGAGVSLHTGTFTFLIPFIMAAFLLQSYCWSPEPTAPIFSASTLLLTSHPIIPRSPASLRDHKTNMDGLYNLSTSSLSNAKKYVSQDISFNKGGLAYSGRSSPIQLPSAPCTDSKGTVVHPASLFGLHFLSHAITFWRCSGLRVFMSRVSIEMRTTWVYRGSFCGF